MRASRGNNGAARRILITALLVMAPSWLSACGAKEGESRAALASATAPLTAATAPSGASALASASAGSTASAPAPSGEADAERTVTFKRGDGAGTVSLPLVGVPTEYGVDGGDEPPALLPKTDIPAQAFAVPADQASELALYWMNLGYEDRGFMMLAPKGWTVKGTVGANGSFGMHAEDPEDAGRFLDTIDTAGSCQGCAIADIGAYFPDMDKWAEEQGFPVERPKPFESVKAVGDHMIEFSEEPKTGQQGYGILGAAYEEHEGDSLFRSATTGYAQQGKDIAGTMIAFYEWMYRER